MVKIKKGLIEFAEAHKICEEYGRPISRQGLYDWIHHYNLGEKVVGRYVINERRLRDLLEGKLK